MPADYNTPDCAYPDATPAVAEVDGDGIGPWVGGASGAGALASISLSSGGSAYTSAPAVHFSAGNATASSIISGSVASLTLTSGGTGYTGIPAVKLVGGGGNGATATAATTGFVGSATVSSGGSGYTSAPAVGFSGGGGTGALATAVISGSITSVTVSNAGRGYTTTPTITFTGGGSGSSFHTATATANMTGSVSSVTITNGGSYSSGTPTVTFSAPAAGGVQATGTASMTGSGSSRHVASVTISNPGSNYSGTVTVTFSATGTQTAAQGTVNLAQSVASVTITSPGSGYTSTPTISFTNAPAGGVRATGTAHESATVVAVNITNGGSGYTSAPTISFTGGGGSGAAAAASLLNRVASVTLTAGGSGYSSAPQVQFIPGDGNGGGAAATAGISGSVVSVVLNSAGSGYTSVPSVSFAGGGGSGAAATASLSNGKLVITALGDQNVDNYDYSGPQANLAPYNQQKVLRHYGFGNQCSTPDGSATCNTVSSVTIGGMAAQIVSWSATSITVNVPSNVPDCAVQQQAQYGGSHAACGELVITAGNGKQSIDAVTVTVGGKSPTLVTPGQTIQSAIDAAAPGDLIMLSPGTYSEMVLMWKPLRLQGVGAVSSTIDASPHPAGKLDPWRRQVDCLFGLALNGQPQTGATGSNPYDSSNTFSCPGNMSFFSGGPNYPTMGVDRIPMEGTLGWDTTVNGNLAEQLIEPSLMGAYEGAGITVLGKGVKIPAGSTDVFGSGAEAAFPDRQHAADFSGLRYRFGRGQPLSQQLPVQSVEH